MNSSEDTMVEKMKRRKKIKSGTENHSVREGNSDTDVKRVRVRKQSDTSQFVVILNC